MNERPILFSAPMINALLEGRKTQTRRIVKPQPIMSTLEDKLRLWASKNNEIVCPYIPGERRWVQDPYQSVGCECMEANPISIETASVRVERLQDISYEDCEAEGMIVSQSVDPDADAINTEYSFADGVEPSSCHVEAFAFLWHSIHKEEGPHGWAANPWVWVVSFRRIA